jgi:hypothetical protein
MVDFLRFLDLAFISQWSFVSRSAFYFCYSGLLIYSYMEETLICLRLTMAFWFYSRWQIKCRRINGLLEFGDKEGWFWFYVEIKWLLKFGDEEGWRRKISWMHMMKQHFLIWTKLMHSFLSAVFVVPQSKKQHLYKFSTSSTLTHNCIFSLYSCIPLPILPLPL